MKVTGLDGRRHDWDLTGHTPLGSEEVGSRYHDRCRALLSDKFPCDRRLEEVPLPGSGRKPLRADFYLPMRKLIVEVHGEQHYKFILHFHQTRVNFLMSQKRDRDKEEWATLNGLYYVELPYDESDDQWWARIDAALGGGGATSGARPGP